MYIAEAKARAGVRTARKAVEKFRWMESDLLNDAGLRKLRELENNAVERSRAAASPGELRRIEGDLRDALRTLGGGRYLGRRLRDNIETFLSASIVLFGIGRYFFTPFRVSSDSMAPAYAARKLHVFERPGDDAGPARLLFRLALLGARHEAAIAERSGPIAATFVLRSGSSHPVLLFSMVRGADGPFAFEACREYVFFVDGTPFSVQIPAKFDLEPVIRTMAGLTDEVILRQRPGNSDSFLVTLPYPAERGKSFLSFDIIAADCMLVDRMRYHFVRPKVGDAVVFTNPNDRGALKGEYFVKRLVGIGGDRLVVGERRIIRNETPAPAPAGPQQLQSGRDIGNFLPGSAARFLKPGATTRVPEGFYFVVGDNYLNSEDSRHWGPVAQRNVCGAALFNYFPFMRP